MSVRFGLSDIDAQHAHADCRAASDLDVTKHDREQGVCDQSHGENAEKYANNENRLFHRYSRRTPHGPDITIIPAAKGVRGDAEPTNFALMDH